MFDIDYETEKLEYKTTAIYKPDFIITFADGRKMYLEVKGYLSTDDRKKMLSVKEHHPDADIRFVFEKDNKLNKKAKMTYSKWCEKNNFPYCFKTIPNEWLM